MNRLEHTILRTRPNTPGLPRQGGPALGAVSDATGEKPELRDTFTPGPILDESLPDLSGFANFNRHRLLAVRDSKDNSNEDRVLLVDKRNGALTPVAMDWSKTGMARDLEAITPSAQQKGRFLAVEGSSYGEKKARLFELSVDGQGGKAEKSHVLPEFGQEIEGVAAIPGDNGKQTLLFAGRGGDGQQGRIYWGELAGDGLNFSPQGLTGQPVQAPVVGPGQRDLAELTVDKNGNLWGTAAVDSGDDGPFRSALYQVGRLTPQGAAPFEARLGQSYRLDHIKAEAMAVQGNGTFFIGSDNESSGGRFESLLV